MGGQSLFQVTNAAVAPAAAEAPGLQADLCGSFARAEAERGRFALRPGRGHSHFALPPNQNHGGLASLAISSASVAALAACFSRLCEIKAAPRRKSMLALAVDPATPPGAQHPFRTPAQSCRTFSIPFDAQVARTRLDSLLAGAEKALRAKLDMLAHVRDFERALCATLSEFDVVVTPLTRDFGRYCTPFSLAGWAMVGIPCPGGAVQLAARPGMESALLDLAHDAELAWHAPDRRMRLWG